MFTLKAPSRAALFLVPLFLFPVSSGFSASAPAIGVATANGKFTLNHANHRNNATLFEGNTFDSGSSELEFRLANGTIVQLGASARGTIYRDRILIEDGGGDVRPGSAYSVEALSLQVKLAQQGAVARVVVSGGQVQVGALRGQLQVFNNKGVLVASIAQGEGDAFTPLSGKIEATKADSESPTQKKVAAAGAAAAGAAAGGAAAGGAAAAGAAVAAGTAAATGIGTAMIVAGVAVVSVGTATGISIATSSGNGDTTLSPQAR
jgi:hypothetical protein